MKQNVATLNKFNYNRTPVQNVLSIKPKSEGTVPFDELKIFVKVKVPHTPPENLAIIDYTKWHGSSKKRFAT